MHIIADVNTISKTAQRNLTFNLVCNFLIQLFPLKSLVFVVHFLNAFWHEKETFPKSSSQNEIAPLLIVFHLPNNKYNGVKICFYSCRFQNQNFSLRRTRVVRVTLVLQSCRQCSNCVALLLHSCSTRITLALHSCCWCYTRVTRVWHSCCKLDQITKRLLRNIPLTIFSLTSQVKFYY